MIKKLANILMQIKIKQAPYISKKKFDEYGFVFLGLYKPNYFDDYLYTHTRAVFYTHDSIKNLDVFLNERNIRAKQFVHMKVGRSFLNFVKFKKFNNILDFITVAIEYNKLGRISTIEQILQDIPTSIYASEEACEKIIDSIMEYPCLLEKFVKIKEKKLKIINDYKLQIEKQNN